MARFPIPFRYPGGKFYAIDILSSYWENIDHDEFREPFLGGGSVFFHKKKSTYNWLNDIDSELMTTYKTMADPVQRLELIDLLKDEEASKERWQEVIDFVPKNDLEIAYKYYYLNRTSFSGKMVSPAWGYRPKRSLPPERWKERILPSGKKLEDVKLTSLDFEKVITSPAIGENVLMFIDPPYFSPSKKKHYRNGFTKDDHKRLASTLKKTNHKFFLTYDDVPEIRELYDWANIEDLEFYYRVDDSSVAKGKRKVGFELIISNYVLPEQGKLFELEVNNDKK